MHFVALVLIPKSDDPQNEIKKIMKPHYDNDGRNPRGKWDWYQVGGRWTGALTDYNPESDPDNIETCFLCHGTGIRKDPVGIRMRKENPDFTCNKCDGKGKNVKWPTRWKDYGGDIQPIEVVIESGFIPYALVSKKGWKERQEWNGSDFVSFDGDWGKFVQEQISNHDGMVAVIDYHS